MGFYRSKIKNTFKINKVIKIKAGLRTAYSMAREPLFIFLLLSALLTIPFSINAKGGVPISLEFQDAPAPMVLQALADYQQLNLIIAADIGSNLSLRLVDVPWEQALAIVLRMSRLKVEREGAVMMVFTEQDVEDRRLQAEQKMGPESLSNLSLALQYADAEQVADSLNLAEGGLLSPLGSVVVDKRTNTLLIRDTPASLALLNSWLAEMDLPLQQVQLAAHIVTISRENLQELGVRWGMGEPQPTSALRMSDFNVNLPLPTSAVSAGFNVARIGGGYWSWS